MPFACATTRKTQGRNIVYAYTKICFAANKQNVAFKIVTAPKRL